VSPYMIKFQTHRQIMLTDTCMHSILTAFIETHTMLPLSNGPICFVDEGIFTSIKRMRTLMPMTWHSKYPDASTLELRGEWHYPVMMMNDRDLIDPDSPVIIVRNAIGDVLVRLKPKTSEDVIHMLEHDVFDVKNMQARVDESKRAAEDRALDMKKRQFIMRKRVALDAQLTVAVEETVDKFDEDIRVLARQIAQHLRSMQFEVHLDLDQSSTVSALDAFVDGAGCAAVAKAVEARLCRVLMDGV
jgi:hypothetical protein